MTISEYIKNLKIEKGFSNQELGELAGINPSYISLIENNKRKPSPAILEKIAPHLGTTYENLMQIAGYTKPDITLKENTKEGVTLSLVKDLIAKGIITSEKDLTDDLMQLIVSTIKLEIKLQCEAQEESE